MSLGELFAEWSRTKDLVERKIDEERLMARVLDNQRSEIEVLSDRLDALWEKMLVVTNETSDRILSQVALD